MTSCSFLYCMTTCVTFFFINPLTTVRANILAPPFLAINRQPLELESCSNPLQIQQVWESKSKKNFFFVLGLRFSGGNVTSRGVFALFWPSLPGPRRYRNGPFFGLKV